VATGEQEAAGEREIVGAVARYALAVQFEDNGRRLEGSKSCEHGFQRRQCCCRWEQIAQARAASARCTRSPTAFFDKNAHAGSAGVGGHTDSSVHVGVDAAASGTGHRQRCEQMS